MPFSYINLSFNEHSVLTQRKVSIEWLAHKQRNTNQQRGNTDMKNINEVTV